MRDKDSGKKIFWIYPTNKFVWAGVVICSIFCAFMIYFLCVANLSENKGFFVKFGGNLFFISTVFLFFFLNPIKSCRYVCFLVTLKTPHH